VSFDTITPHYRWLETITFGNRLQAARIAFLDRVGTPKRALIAGEGNGRFLQVLLREHPAIVVDCVDESARMLQLARERVHHESRVQFLRRDLMAWSPEENAYELIVTHFFLDCFTEDEIAIVVAKLARAATAGAIWLLADFSVPRRSVAKIHAQIWLRVMYRFFRMTTGITGRELTDASEFLRTHGFRPATRNLRQFGLIKSELWQRGGSSAPRSMSKLGGGAAIY
jgi:ubiquinone/menaquinone biosynthesis C-methylase UbiE